ncbi:TRANSCRIPTION FACTOR IBH1-LIKE 1 [Salix purpurea]|uniref:TRANSCRIPTION FACTOR IBH1-LIKE 1 n=1 Tax=Salix purpurea TaxID=77065 RepID=A0A9Q0WFX7_SALPP|nr:TRANSCRIPTION FACTOR IBH1-LIKE 1 [Salix purpurea]
MSSMLKRSKVSLRRTERSRRGGGGGGGGRHARSCRAQRSICSGGFVTSPGTFSDKMEALKNLVPATHNGEIVKADQLFQETADYIVLLRTQVLVLKGLIDFYGSSSEKDKAAVL